MNKTESGTGTTIYESGLESFCLSSEDIFAYGIYKRVCINKKIKPKSFSVWLKTIHHVEVPTYLKTSIDKGLGK